MILKSLSLCCAIYVALGISAQAQTVPIRSGEHLTFTRLVAEIGAQRDWETGREGNIFYINFSPDAPDFDISPIYNFINRDRIADVSTNEGLTLELGCRCSVTVERYREDFIIIDIAETEEIVGVENDPGAPAVSIDSSPSAAAGSIPLFAGTRQAAQVSLNQHQDGAAPTIEPSPALSTAADILAEQMARAAAAGLLNAAPGQPFSSADPLGNQQPTGDDLLSAHHETQGEVAIGEAPIEPLSPTVPISTANAFDLNAGTTAVEIFSPHFGSCMSPPARDFTDWTEGMSFSHGVGVLRSNIFDDRGDLNGDVALRLTEFYLAHGFGAEAAFWLDETDAPAVFQHAMAQYLEFDEPNAFGAFDGTQDCSGPILFWMFLAAVDPARPDSDSRDVILAEFFRFPAPSRDQFGTRLVQQFLSVGDNGAALEIRENLLRGNRLPDHELQLISAEMAQHAQTPARRSAPGNVDPSTAGSVNANRSMALYLRQQIETRGTVQPGDLLAADALILESNPPLEEFGLVHMTTVGHALRGNVEVVLQHLQRGQDQDIQAVFSDIVQTLMVQEHTAELILLLSSQEYGQFGHFQNHASRRRVARYFLDHGVPNLARDIIASGGAPHNQDREILSAAMDRLARDRSMQAPQLQSFEVAGGTDLTARDSVEDISALLEESQALRAVMVTILQENSGAITTD